MKRLLIRVIIVGLILICAGYDFVKADDELKDRIDSMFIIASSGDFKFRELVQPTIDDMAAIGVDAVPYLIDRLGTEDGRERVTLENIFKKIGSPAVPRLNRALLETDSLQLARVAKILFYLPDSSSVDNLLKVAENPYYWARYQTVRALGKIGDMKARPAIETALLDDNELIRTMAAVAAGRIDTEAFFPLLITALNDNYYGVRMAALEELKKLDCPAKMRLIPFALAESETDMTRSLLLSIMADDSCVYNMDSFESMLEETAPVILSLALKVAFKSDADWVIDQYSDKSKDAESLILRQTFKELMEAYEAKKTPANP